MGKTSSYQDSPRLIVGLLAAAFGFVVLLTWLILYLPNLGDQLVVVFSALKIGLGVMLIVLLIGIIALVWMLRKHRFLAIFDAPIQWTLRVLLPVAMFLGRLLKVPKDLIRRSYIGVHNRLTQIRKQIGVVPDRLLVLVPACLQRFECRMKVTGRVENCQKCGACPIGDLLALRERLGFQLVVSAGGTQARRAVVEYQPEAMVAVACERDLVSGICDVDPRLNVLGIINQRPKGPCFETEVDLRQLENAVLSLLAPR
ncbi:MAG: DUF116 domain-containing protein [Limnochordia bacterium]|jgi:hypothetical protein